MKKCVHFKNSRKPILKVVSNLNILFPNKKEVFLEERNDHIVQGWKISWKINYKTNFSFPSKYACINMYGLLIQTRSG